MNRRVWLLAAGALVMLLGCNSSYSDYCDKRTKCLGGNDKDKSACIDVNEGQEKGANDYGCGDQYGKLKDCLLNGSTTCNNGQFTITANCSSQSQTYSTCLSNATSEKGSTTTTTNGNGAGSGSGGGSSPDAG